MLVTGRHVRRWGGGRQGPEEGSGRKCLYLILVQSLKGEESSEDQEAIGPIKAIGPQL